MNRKISISYPQWFHKTPQNSYKKDSWKSRTGPDHHKDEIQYQSTDGVYYKVWKQTLIVHLCLIWYTPCQQLQFVVVTHQIQERSNKRLGRALSTASREKPADGQKHYGYKQKLIRQSQRTAHPDRAKEGELHWIAFLKATVHKEHWTQFFFQNCKCLISLASYMISHILSRDQQ